MKNKQKKAIIGNLFVMIFAFILIIIILLIFLFFSSASKPLKNIDEEFLKIQSKSMAYHSLKFYLQTEIEIEKHGEDNKGKISMADLIDAWSADKSIETKLKQETDTILSVPFQNCYRLEIIHKSGNLFIGSASIEDYAEIIIPSRLEDTTIQTKLALDNKCLGIEK